MPRCNAAYLAAFDQGDDDLDRAGITLPLRQSHFLAQFGGETNGGLVLYESGNYKTVSRLMAIFGAGHHSAAITEEEAGRIVALPMPRKEQVLFERVYGAGNPRKMVELGNKAGDGYAFRGTGVLQSTGRGAAKRWGDKLGVNFADHPELMVDPRHALAPALYEWTAGRCNNLADRNDARTIRRYINGGYNGMADVEAWLAKVYAAAKADAQPEHPWQAATSDVQTQQMQAGLNGLGYAPKLTVDGKLGPATKAAVEWFQKLNGLAVDGIAGPVTMTAINMRFATKRGVASQVDGDQQETA